MSLSQLQEVISQNKSTYIEQLFRLLEQKSISTHNDGIRECAHLVKKIMDEMAIQTTIMETSGHPVVYGQMMNDKSDFTLLIYGHYDVQAPDPIEEWQSPPFEPTIRDGRIYARGAGDNKGQLMAQLLAINTYIQEIGDLPINIKILFEGEEETRSPNLAEFVENHQELLKADLVYTADGSSHSSGSPLLLLGVRGCLDIELKVKSANRENHSGNCGNIIPNPAWRLVQVLQSMRDETGHVLVEGFYDQILPPSKYENELLRSLPFDVKDVGEKIGYPELQMDGETYYRLTR